MTSSTVMLPGQVIVLRGDADGTLQKQNNGAMASGKRGKETPDESEDEEEGARRTRDRNGGAGTLRCNLMASALLQATQRAGTCHEPVPEALRASVRHEEASTALCHAPPSTALDELVTRTQALSLVPPPTDPLLDGLSAAERTQVLVEHERTKQTYYQLVSSVVGARTSSV